MRTTQKAQAGDVESMYRAARLYLVSRYPFYGILLAHFRVHFTTRLPTAAVDARDNLYLNPDFFASLRDVRVRGCLLAHEALHVALGIFFRGRGHNPELSNIAHDLVVNLILATDAKDWLPPGALLDMTLAGMSYEEVYGRLRKNGRPREGLPMADVLPGGLDGLGSDSSGQNSPTEAANAAQVWQSRLVAAQLFAIAQGKGSLGAEIAVGSAKGSSVPWQEKLRSAVTESIGRARADWTRPHRRSSALGFFLPRETATGFDCAVYTDTSGSITQENNQTGCREIGAIIDACGGKARWLQGDAAILGDEWLSEAPTTLAGGGGTSFVPLFEHLRDNPPTSLVIFTDTFGEMPDFVPDFPVVWAVYCESESEVAGRVVPFGEIVPVPEHAF